MGRCERRIGEKNGSSSPKIEVKKRESSERLRNGDENGQSGRARRPWVERERATEQRNPSPRWIVPPYSSMIVCSGSTLPLSRAACEGSGLEGRELAGVGYVDVSAPPRNSNRSR